MGISGITLRVTYKQHTAAFPTKIFLVHKYMTYVSYILRQHKIIRKVIKSSQSTCMHKCLWQQVFHVCEYYISITIVRSDTGKYHEYVAMYYYECEARVIMLQATYE